MRLPPLLLALSLWPVLVMLTPGAHAQGPPPAKVYVDAATEQTVDTYREVTGSLRPAKRSVVASREAGVVELLDLAEGDTVEAGDVLAVLDDDLLAFDVQRARAEVDRDQGLIHERTGDLENAQRDLARLESLRERGSATPVELDDARTTQARFTAQLAQAKADLAADSALLAAAERRLANATIRAPFGGRIVSKSTEVGEWIPVGGPVLELLAMDTVECWLNVPDTAVKELTPAGTSVRVRIDALERTIEARVAAVIPDADPLSRLFPVRLVLDNPDGTLAPGMSVTGLVPTGVPGVALTIAGDAVRFDELGEYVFVDRSGTAGVARVQTVYAVGDRVVIRPGALRPGDRVVVEGNERLFPGQPLIVLGENAAAGAG